MILPLFSNKLVAVLFGLVFALVAINILTPLRLNNDAVRYLNIVEYLDGHLDKGSEAAHDFFPHGYPVFLWLLGKAQLLNPIFITSVNICSILLSCYLLVNIFQIQNALLFVTLVLLSFINVKHFTLPVADQLFSFTFFAAIYCWSKFYNGSFYFLLLAVLFTALAIYLRTAGLALIIGLLFYIVNLNRLLLKSKVLLAATTLIFLVVIIIVAFELPVLEHKMDYIRQLNLEMMIYNPFSITQRLLLHIQEIGELVINMPYSKLQHTLKIKGFDAAYYLFVLTGAVSLYAGYRSVVALQLFKHFAFWSFIAYLLMIFIWPFYDTRFWIPVIPEVIYLIFYFVYTELKAKSMRLIIVSVYVISGMVSLIYSDALSLNNKFFLAHYGSDPALTEKYHIHFKNRQATSISAEAYNIQQDNILYLLEKYDR